MKQSSALQNFARTESQPEQDPRSDSAQQQLAVQVCAPVDAWPIVLKQIRKRIHPQSFHWFQRTYCYEGDPRTLRLAVPSKFHQDFISDHYFDFLHDQLQDVCGVDISIELVVAPELIPETPEEEEPASNEPQSSQASAPQLSSSRQGASTQSTNIRTGPAQAHVGQLNPRYRFDSFVTGGSNQFARAASEAVAANPAGVYNPLFIYGGVGLGKTHLLHAIGHEILRRNPRAKVNYVTTEAFMNDLIDSLHHGKMGAFRARYRSECDVLLVDDIQFLSGKERTQEEFFHTFNYLYESQRQVVISSDKFPHEIPGIEERLRTRFQSGLIADITAPEMETRVAILRAKAEAEQISLPDDVAMFLATHIKSNVRELEGALIRLQAYASLSGQALDLPMAQQRMRGMVAEQNKVLNAEQVQKIVANYYSVKVADLRGSRRHRAIAAPRQVAMYLCRKHCGLSYNEIGQSFGGKDHSTVISAVRKIEKNIDSDPKLGQTIQTLENSLL